MLFLINFTCKKDLLENKTQLFVFYLFKNNRMHK